MMVKAIERAVAYLHKTQSSDGGFLGLASAHPDDFAAAHHHPTVFFSALILECLADVPQGQSVRDNLARFLLRHKSETWSWNYWVRGEVAAKLRAYPDDLDDTACALAALYHHDPRLVDGAVQAHLASQLIAAEVKPGGPYRTWLVGSTASEVWRDVDVAVNANIGYLLSLLGVELPGLEGYITGRLEGEGLASTYYVGTAPTLYFVARWYRGVARKELSRLITTQLAAKEHYTNSLMQAMLITAALRVGIEPGRLRTAVERLISCQGDEGGWPATALYYEPPVDGALYYAGSSALTTAFCLEALGSYKRSLVVVRQPGQTDQMKVMAGALERSNLISHYELRRRFRTQIRQLAAHDHDRQITAIATTTALALGVQLPASTLLKLNVASLSGWVAYTIYDDFLDGEGRPSLLGAANVALRQTLQSFLSALPKDALFQQAVSTALDRVDGANTWEVVRARASVQRGVVRIKRLPDYGDYAQLAERSWGHTLAATGVMRAAGYLPEGPEIMHLEEFFRHFLIARQLNDDAHDWEEDLSRGHLTAAVTLLLRVEGMPCIIDLASQREGLRLRFWEETITLITSLIKHHAMLARRALVKCVPLRHTEEFERLIAALERSAQRALVGRDEAQKFIATYRRPVLQSQCLL